MMQYSEQDRTLALAGVSQGARLARDIARTGMCDATAFAASRGSLFAFDVDSVVEIYGSVRAMAYGLRSLLGQLEGGDRRDLEVARYIVALLHLADRLLRDRQTMQELHDGLRALDRRQSHFELGQESLNEQLSELYQAHISPLGSRIMVHGEPLHLQNSENAAKIRVALIAGIRSAVLWRQAGGRKWPLLLHRRAIADVSRELVDSIDT